MKYFTFKRESNNFDDILKDINLKKHIDEVTSWTNHVRIGMTDDDKIFSYITLKYGDEMINKLTESYAPIANVDYVPIRR